MKLLSGFSQRYVIIFLLILLIVISCYFSFIKGHNHKQIIVLAPNSDPTKIKPHGKSDNIIFKNENSIYDKVKPAIDHNIIKLRPDPEEPIHLQDKNINEDVVKNFIDGENVVVPSKNYDLVNISDENDDTIDSIITDFESGELSIAEANIKDNLVSATKDVKSSKDDNKLKIVRIEDNHQSNYLSNSSPDKVIDNYWKIQLGIFKAESDAYTEWEKIKQENESLFINCEVIVRKSKYITDKVFYTLLIGNYSSMGKAKAICRKLKIQNQHCIVSR